MLDIQVDALYTLPYYVLIVIITIIITIVLDIQFICYKSFLQSNIARNPNTLDDEFPNFEEAGPASYSSSQNGSFSPFFTIINFKNPAEEERKQHEKNCRYESVFNCLFYFLGVFCLWMCKETTERA